MGMRIEQLHTYHPLWPGCMEHLRGLNMARWVLNDDAQLKPAMYILCAVLNEHITGHIALKMQVITVPADCDGDDVPLVAPDGRLLREMFVRTFGVEEVYRRRGYGRALQLAGLDLARTFGCFQMRSWSSLDKTANYALKLSMGFAVHPATHHPDGGEPVSGVYFVKTIT